MLLLWAGRQGTRGYTHGGYTHLQPAQPIRPRHWLIAPGGLVRDAQRLKELIPRAQHVPVGLASQAGNAFGIDREFMAAKLVSDGVSPNSLMPPVTATFFVVEFPCGTRSCWTHLSRRWKRDYYHP
jgi:argininosuccinate lyase